ncbi:nitroreductase/quinone reductase family protein [Actinomadura rugatobispora]|uniref:Nitroreductase/quinone reductase family protein n=1 Tax=Actinomadura rugatobispora TaxID=1994 RepID=A0ABW1ADF8_9ACTN|nr:nitroreductase/quinone reductase family protein [Actinomadura rugatobispora]
MAEEFSPAEFNRAIIEEFRANGGRVGGMFEGATLVLLTTTGSGTGRRRTSPLTYMPDGDRILVFASNAGGPGDPAWYGNLLADSRVTVEIGTDDGTGVETYAATALPLHGEERDRLYTLQGELVPAYAEYQRMTERVIPVVALYRADSARSLALGDVIVQAHATLRADLASLREEVEAYLTGAERGERPEPDAAARLRTHCVAFCSALGEHHDGEENRGFPPLRRLHPELGPVLDRLRREHAQVARLRAELQETLDGMASADPATVRAQFDRVTADLEAHYAYEESELFTTLNTLTPADWAGPTTG